MLCLPFSGGQIYNVWLGESDPECEAKFYLRPQARNELYFKDYRSWPAGLDSVLFEEGNLFIELMNFPCYGQVVNSQRIGAGRAVASR